MSEVSESPSVLAIAALPAGLLFGGIVLTGVIVRKLSNSLDKKVQATFAEAMDAIPQHSAEVLRPLSLVEKDSHLHMKSALQKLERLRLPPAEQMRLSTLVSLAAGPYIANNLVSLDQPLAALLSAKTPEETANASAVLHQQVHAGHQQVFTRGLTHVCANAVRQIGFSSVETGMGPLGDVRLIGTDADGRSLVVEIQKGENGDPGLAAEVLGVRDGSCHKILDAFETALAEKGVRYTQPRRTATGGVCQLQAARDFLRRHVDRGYVGRSGGTSNDSQRRTQRLNQQKVRQGQ
jgi:hypothetical protein